MRCSIAALLASVPLAAFALGDDIPADREIVGVSVSSTSALVQISPAFADSQGCLQSGSGWLKIDLATGKSLFTTALTAATAKQIVGFNLLGCLEDYPVVKRVDITY